jgi:hypothetical protein
MATSDENKNGQTGLESIPGLGIIRIRSLRKAGWNDGDALRKATAEEIAAVPGITLEKAQAILEYLNGAKAPPKPRQRRAAPLAIVAPVESPGDAVCRVADRAATLLSGERALDFDRALARQIARVVAIKDHAAGAATLNDKKCARLKKALDGLDSTLGKIEGEKKLRGKKQQKVAEDLRDARRTVADLLESGLA